MIDYDAIREQLRQIVMQEGERDPAKDRNSIAAGRELLRGDPDGAPSGEPEMIGYVLAKDPRNPAAD